MNNPMVEMSQAIPLVLQRYGATLQKIPDDPLNDFATVVAAYSGDLQREVARREGGVA